MDVQNHITRLSRYKSIVKQFKAIGMTRIFAKNIADAGHLKPAQVRKDFYIFDITGNKKGGYSVDELLRTFEALIGTDKPQPVIVMGYGRIGSALVNYPGFMKNNIKIFAAFDPDPGKQDPRALPPVLDPGELKTVILESKIKIAVLAVPDPEAQQTLNKLVKLGITGILNFSSRSLYAPSYVFMNHLDLNMAMETVIFQCSSPVKDTNDE